MEARLRPREREIEWFEREGWGKREGERCTGERDIDGERMVCAWVLASPARPDYINIYKCTLYYIIYIFIYMYAWVLASSVRPRRPRAARAAAKLRRKRWSAGSS